MQKAAFNPSTKVGFTQKQTTDLMFTMAKTIMAEVNMRLDLLEHKNLRYEGVYEAGTAYTKGAVCTYRGTIWYCKESHATGAPGKPNSGWQMMVKTINPKGVRA